MKFKIGKNVNPTNIFQVEVLFMQGDGDGYPTRTYDQGIDANNAIPCIEFFQRCKALYQFGMRGDDGYWKVEGYYPVGVTDKVDPEYGLRENEGQWDIPDESEHTNGHASVTDIKMFWYNNSGVKHEVIYD